MAGFRAAKKLWTGNVTDAEKDQVLEGLRVTRPVLVSGWETVLMARIFAEEADAAPKILHDWPALMDVSLKAWGTDLGELRRVFEEERNAWMDEEEAEWQADQRHHAADNSSLQHAADAGGPRGGQAAEKEGRGEDAKAAAGQGGQASSGCGRWRC